VHVVGKEREIRARILREAKGPLTSEYEPV